MKNLCIDLYTRMMMAVQAFKNEERGAVDIVAIVVMIGIAVALAVVFRTQIKSLLDTLFDTINSSATSAVGSY